VGNQAWGKRPEQPSPAATPRTCSQSAAKLSQPSRCDWLCFVGRRRVARRWLRRLLLQLLVLVLALPHCLLMLPLSLRQL
jgi:hypothetical protein